MSRLARIAVLFGALATALSGAAAARDLPQVRLGLLKFGTVNWEARTIIDEGFDKAHGFTLEIIPLASGEATKIAMQGGAIDVTTGDWLFVSRQRTAGTPLTFVPYSSSIGAIMVPCGSALKALPDLAGKKIGVAGGPLDKSWLMLQGLAKARYGFDLASRTTPVFAAPPLLAEKLREGELDAALNYWNYNAVLETENFCPMISAQDAAKALGAKGDISAVGYVLNEAWADAHPDLAKGFVAASRDAKHLLKMSDAAWQRIRPMMNASSDAVFAMLKRRYREGIPDRPVALEERDTAKIYDYLAKAGGTKLVGSAKAMAPGTFWSGLKDGS